MQTDDGLLNAFLFDGVGGGRRLGWEEIRASQPDQGVVWVHLDYSHANSKRWLEQDAGLSEVVFSALEAEETRPRAMLVDGALLLTLRSVNLNPESDPEDMVAMRIWTDGQRIISARRRRLRSANYVAEQLLAGKGPGTVGEFVAMVVDHLVNQMSDVIDEIDDRVDALEERVLTAQSHSLRAEIADLRRDAISLRRYLAPQRDALTRLFSERISWLTDKDRMHLREATDRTMRYIEDLDSARDRASVTHEELMGRLSEQMDKRMYVLSIVAALFLPLGFLTGLLGINVGGIPGAEDKHAFVFFSLMLVTIVALQILFFKRKKWF